MSVEFLKRHDAPALAYQRTNGENEDLPMVLFLHGLWSDMEGTKAAFLSNACNERGQALLRFDFRGHGRSEGRFEDFTIGDWLQDALDVIDNLTQGPLIVVGSSMGGWIALLAALRRPERIKALIGLAAAPDFTNEIKQSMDARQRDLLQQNGYFHLHGEGTDFPCIITAKLLEDGAHHGLLSGPIAIDCPVRLVQGLKDEDVPQHTAQKIADALAGKDTKIYWRENGDHRLASPDDLKLLNALVVELSHRKA